jgi:hypothetical protein
LTPISDRLFAELDRQLTEVRAIADGIAQRAGLLTSAAALAAGLMGSRLPVLAKNGWAIAALVAFGLAAAFGIAAVAPSMSVGVESHRLSNWNSVTSTGGQERQRTTEMFSEKLQILNANRNRLKVVLVLYYIQVLAVVLAIVAALIATGEAPAGSGSP